jgi:hypothetical protein
LRARVARAGVAGPYLEIFVGLLGVYLVVSAMSHLDPRYPIVAALLLLVSAGVADAANAVGLANTLAEFVFLLLGGGVVLLLVERLRGTPAPAVRSGMSAAVVAPQGGAPEPADQRDPHPQERLDGVEEHLVPAVDAPRGEDAEQEPDRDGDGHDGEGPERQGRAKETEDEPDRDAGG